MKNLVTKLSKIMGKLDTIGKSGYNEHHKYAYVMEADILEHVRSSLADNNIFVFSSVLSSTKEGDLTTVLMEYTLVDGDSGESVKVQAAGQGADRQDKGIYKAITGANKYFLLKNFMLPTGDDPENEGAQKHQQKPVAKAADTKNAPKPVSKSATPSPTSNAELIKPSGGFGPAKAAAPKASNNSASNVGAWS
jgi:hypothetical protein